jgi:hypothetical protein
MFKNLLAFCLLVLFLQMSAQSASWSKKHDENGLQVFVRGKKTNEYKATLDVDANVSSCVALMQDFKSHIKFMGSVKEIGIVEVKNDLESLFKCTVDMPFPMSDQEIVSTAVFTPISGGGVRIDLKAEPNAIPKGKLKRMKTADGYWLFEKISELKTRVTYQLRFEESNAPNWIVNFFVLDNPVKTMTGFAREVKALKYKNSKISWL